MATVVSGSRVLRRLIPRAVVAQLSTARDDTVPEELPSVSTLTVGDQTLRKKVLNELEQQCFGGSPWSGLSKTAQSKLIAIRVKKIIRAQRKKKENIPVSKSMGASHGLREDLKQRKRAALKQSVLNSELRVVVDCSWEDAMSPKEITRLVSHIRKMHHMNIKTSKPARLCLTGLHEKSRIIQESFRQDPAGFNGLLVDVVSTSITELFSNDEMVYLSPDSPNILTELDNSKVYILGGLVDENIKKGATYQKASLEGVATAQLPIGLFMSKAHPNPHGTVLCINQVLGVLLDRYAGGSWAGSLARHIPKRKGFIINESSISNM